MIISRKTIEDVLRDCDSGYYNLEIKRRYEEALEEIQKISDCTNAIEMGRFDHMLIDERIRNAELVVLYGARRWYLNKVSEELYKEGIPIAYHIKGTVDDK